MNTQDRLDSLVAEYNHAVRTVTEERTALKSVRIRLTDALTARDLLQKVAQSVQQIAHKRLASVVTRCLRVVFAEDAYTFRIDFYRKRGRTEAVLVLERNGMVLENPLEEAGGGVCEVAALALRLSLAVLSIPKKRLMFCLDEPLRALNGVKYQERIAGLLETLCEELGVQLLIVSDDDWLRVGKVVELS